MNRSRYLLAFATSIAGFAGIATGALANDIAPAPTQLALAQDGDVVNTDLSAQGGRRGGGGGFGGGGRQGGGNFGRVGGGGRQGGNIGRIGNVGRIGTVNRVGRIGRVGRIDGRVGYQGRIGRRVGYQGYVGYPGRVGYRVGRYGRYGRYGVGRIGYYPPPVVIPVPVGPGPVVRPTTVAPCPVCPVQACLLAVYTEPNLTGATLETRDSQPRLDLIQLQNQISSVIVKSGTWDFFPDLEYRGGPPLRLAPGSYVVLEPQWTKRIGSFMCVR